MIVGFLIYPYWNVNTAFYDNTDFIALVSNLSILECKSFTVNDKEKAKFGF